MQPEQGDNGFALGFGDWLAIRPRLHPCGALLWDRDVGSGKSRATMTQRARYCFAAGNAFVATLILAFGLALAIRQWAFDAAFGAAILLLYFSALKAATDRRMARRWLRIGALTLLLFGVTVTSVSVLAFAFLTGVYGQLLLHGAETLAWVVVASAPYLLIYPVMVLTWTARTDEAP